MKLRIQILSTNAKRIDYAKATLNEEVKKHRIVDRHLSYLYNKQ